MDECVVNSNYWVKRIARCLCTGNRDTLDFFSLSWPYIQAGTLSAVSTLFLRCVPACYSLHAFSFFFFFFFSEFRAQLLLSRHVNTE